MTTCLSCGGDRLARVRPYRFVSRRGGGREVFGAPWLVECARCGLVQAEPRPSPDALTRYYREDYRKGGLHGADVADPAAFPRDNLFYFNRGRSIAELAAAHVTASRPRVLDIGAGWGHLLHALAERFPGAERHAIEYSRVCVDHLTAIGVTVDTRPAEEVLPAVRGRFDLITLSHVLEHLLRPADALRLMRDALAPGGVLYVEVPHIGRDALRRHADHRWAPRFDEPHVTFFAPDALRRLVAAAGFTELFCDTAGPRYRYISGLRFRLPPLRATVAGMLPKPVFDYLRGQAATSALRVQDREPEFYEYGGDRIWIRSVWRGG